MKHIVPFSYCLLKINQTFIHANPYCKSIKHKHRYDTKYTSNFLARKESELNSVKFHFKPYISNMIQI